ncbi:sensor histidine kinase [Streptomyces sp. NBC_00344]|uniref:sensor histidine kinase n=1 Tax=Streptomyces sp. NBC_00344 TaxID=2975720 RepID=UPI002E2421BB
MIDGSFVWAEHPPLWEWGGALLGFSAIMGLQLAVSFPGFFPGLAGHRYLTWALLALLAFAPMAVFGQSWCGMLSFFSASAILVFPAWLGRTLCAAGVLAVWVIFARDDVFTVGYNVIEAVLIPLIIVGLSRMSEMIVELHDSRAELSRLAVAAERLRFARDLHGFLGLSLSAVTLKCELAQRLLAEAPGKAQEELTVILRTSRKALADVRSVSRGYREMSLCGEADAAVSMLSAAGIRTSLHFACGELPGMVDTVLATVLREGLTNLLRHSKAGRCRIRAERREDNVVLTLSNDGIVRERQPKRDPGGGLASLDCRIGSLGGSLAHGPDSQGWFRLQAVLPLTHDVEQTPGEGSVAAPGSDGPGQPPLRPPVPERQDMVPRAAVAITLAVLVGYFLAYSVISLSYQPPPAETVSMMLCLFATLLVQLAVSFQWRFISLARRPRLMRQGALGAMLLLQCVPWLFLGPRCLGLPGFVAGTALLVLPPAAAWPFIGAVTVAVDVAFHQADGALRDLVYETAYTLICALVVFGLSRMAQLASELHRSRAEIARLAVTTERLRFARDLHDLLGFSLSAITLKCELVRRLVPASPVQAQRELTEVLDIARRAVTDVRTVAGGDRRMRLTAEVEQATAMLAGVGIHATVRLDCGELPAEVETVLATTIREGLTNMLRHSSAAHCRITAERAAGGVRLSLVNDGVDRVRDPSLDSRISGGSGIGNLATRIEAVNGRLTAGPRPDGWFELRAEVELLAV